MSYCCIYYLFTKTKNCFLYVYCRRNWMSCLWAHRLQYRYFSELVDKCESNKRKMLHSMTFRFVDLVSMFVDDLWQCFADDKCKTAIIWTVVETSMPCKRNTWNCQIFDDFLPIGTTSVMPCDVNLCSSVKWRGGEDKLYFGNNCRSMKYLC